MLRDRLVSGSIIGGALILAIFLLPPIAAWLVLLAISAWGQREFYAMVGAAGISTFRIVGLLSGTAILSVTFFSLGSEPASIARTYHWEQAVLFGTLIAVCIRQFPQKYNKHPLATLGGTLLGIWYIPGLLNFIARLTFSWDDTLFTGRIHPTGRMLILFLVVVVKITDIGAYFVGTWFGRHKLLPRISPGKTWEGLAGGVACAVLAAIVFCRATNGTLGELCFDTRHAAILGGLLAGIGVLGDMFESLLKRACGIKDSGASVPGMGGILDVVDSLLFGAPVLYAYVHLVLT